MGTPKKEKAWKTHTNQKELKNFFTSSVVQLMMKVVRIVSFLLMIQQKKN